MPPSWMWPFEDELEIWFAEVEEERKNKYSPTGGDSDDGDSSMMQNDLAVGRGR